MLYPRSSCVINHNSPLILQLGPWQPRRGGILSVMHAKRCELLKDYYFYCQCKSFLIPISIFCSVLNPCRGLTLYLYHGRDGNPARERLPLFQECPLACRQERSCHVQAGVPKEFNAICCKLTDGCSFKLFCIELLVLSLTSYKSIAFPLLPYIISV